MKKRRDIVWTELPQSFVVELGKAYSMSTIELWRFVKLAKRYCKAVKKMNKFLSQL